MSEAGTEAVHFFIGFMLGAVIYYNFFPEKGKTGVGNTIGGNIRRVCIQYTAAHAA